MYNWLEIPLGRKRLPAERLCVIMALTVLLLLAVAGRKEHPSQQTGAIAHAPA
jgi:hypothetical protein